MIKVMILAAAMLSAGSAYADEVIIHRDAPHAVIVEPPVSSSTTVEHHEHGDGCATKSVHSENDAGDSKTVTKTNCD
jgi:hypothetical protein